MNSRQTRLRSALAVILTVLVLVPTVILFGRVWQDNSGRRDSTALEQKGVEYLTALTSLISSLVEDQSSALQGVNKQSADTTAAIARVSATDARLGGDLRTTPRWALLKDKIAKLPKATGSPIVVFSAHTEVTDLTLALYQAVRRNAALNRDPDNDLSNLQQAVAVEMPETVVEVGRMGDLATIAANATGTIKATVGLQFGEKTVAVQELVDRLTDELQVAVNDTHSRTLSGILISTLDSFRRSIESMNRGVNLGGAPNLATMATAQSSLQTALTSLVGGTLKEMGGLLDDRMSTLNYRRGEAVAMGLLAVVLILGAVIWSAAGRRRPAPVAPPVAGDTNRDIAVPRPGGPGVYGNPYDRLPTYGDDPTRRERSGALR